MAMCTARRRGSYSRLIAGSMHYDISTFDSKNTCATTGHEVNNHVAALQRARVCSVRDGVHKVLIQWKGGLCVFEKGKCTESTEARYLD